MTAKPNYTVERQLLALVAPDAHQTQIRAAYRKVVGCEPREQGYTVERIRERMLEAVAQDAIKPSKAARTVRVVEVADLPKVGKWAKVVAITKTGTKGQPTRVEIACALPGCSETREIATQDLFQVSHCCLAHKREHAKLEAAPARRPLLRVVA